jgi:hypothetical protein
VKKLFPIFLLLLPAVIFSFGGNCGGVDSYAWFMRADPIEPGWYRYSELDEGSIIFFQVGYQSGDIIEGSFDQLQLYDWDADTLIEVSNGTFCCRVG